MPRSPRTVQLDAIDVVLDRKPGHRAPRFLELETSDGKGLRFGRWVRKGNAWALRLPVSALVPVDRIASVERGAAIIAKAKVRKAQTKRKRSAVAKR